MKRDEIIFRQTTRATAKEFFGRTPSSSFNGYEAVLNNKVVGIAGIMYCHGFRMLFSEMTEEFRPYKREVAKAIRILEGIIIKLPYPIVAIAYKKEPFAKKLLIKLGFIPTDTVTEYGLLYMRTP